MSKEDTSYNVETVNEYACVINTDDPAKKHRVQVQTARLASLDPSKCPWIHVTGSTNSQQTSKEGGTIHTPHSFQPGDQLLVSCSLASGESYIHGHPGTITDYSGGGNVDDYMWPASASLHPTGKTTLDKTTYQPNQSYNNPQPAQFTSQYKHVRDRAHAKLQNIPQSSDAQRLHNKAKHIGNSTGSGSDMNSILKLIQKKDPQGGAEATQDLSNVKMLDKLRDSMNQIPAMNGMLDKAKQGLMGGLQSLVGGQGMQIFQQLTQMATQAGQNMNNHNSNPNTANMPYLTTFSLDANGNIIQNGPTAVAGTGPFPVID